MVRVRNDSARKNEKEDIQALQAEQAEKDRELKEMQAVNMASIQPKFSELREFEVPIQDESLPKGVEVFTNIIDGRLKLVRVRLFNGVDVVITPDNLNLPCASNGLNVYLRKEN